MLFYSKKLIMLVFSVVVLSACSLSSEENITRKESKEIESIVDTFLSSKEFNGSILMANDGDIWVSKGYGMANFEDEIPNSPNTRFRIGSVTKQFTAVSILMLQEKGLLKVTDTLDLYVPDYPRGNEITLHHLLTHTSGIQEYLQFIDLTSGSKTYMSPIELIDTFKQKPLNFTPGAEFSYSNSNYILLGYMIEQVSKQSYEEFLYTNIFKPLHMNNSGYDINEHDDTIHARGYEGTMKQHTTPKYDLHMSVPHAAGALYSTAEDLYQWDQALYSKQLLTQTSLNTMYTPHIEIEKDIVSYGYGWFVYNKPLNLVGHSGNIFGYSATIRRNLDNKNLIVVLNNFDSNYEIESIAKRLDEILEQFIE